MQDIPEIDLDGARAHLDAETALFMDVRDPMSFRSGHIPGARHVHDGNIQEFVDGADKEERVIVYCYHGNMSRGGTAYLLSNGFAEVYSMSGGFEGWRQSHEDRISTE